MHIWRVIAMEVLIIEVLNVKIYEMGMVVGSSKYDVRFHDKIFRCFLVTIDFAKIFFFWFVIFEAQMVRWDSLIFKITLKGKIFKTKALPLNIFKGG